MPVAPAPASILSTRISPSAVVWVNGREAAHGRTGVARLVLGSVARNLLHHADSMMPRLPAMASRM
jgi:hypothetical protein